MTLDTIFDVASLTKVVATTTSVMKLVEDGRIRLIDRVSTYIPGLRALQQGRHHDPPPDDAHLGAAAGPRSRRRLDAATTRRSSWRSTRCRPSPPGERFVYSDINYFLLGDIVKRVSGMPLDQFAKKHIFDPLGMKDTMFLPPSSLRPRIAPTEKCTPYGWPCDGPDAQWLRGVVHDPDGAADGRRRRPRRTLQHGGRPLDLRAHAAERRHLQRRAHPVAADGREDDDAGERARRSQRARPRLGHRLVVLVQPRRAAADRLLRPHRVHRHVDLDRSGRRASSSSSCRTACIPTARGT